MPQVRVTGCDNLQGSQSAVELCDSIEAWFPNSPPSVGHGGGPHRRRAFMRAVTPGCRQLPHISNTFQVSSISIFWFIVFRESVGQGVGTGRVARWKLGLGWMAGAGVIITPASFLMCLDQMIQKRPGLAPSTGGSSQASPGGCLQMTTGSQEEASTERWQKSSVPRDLASAT